MSNAILTEGQPVRTQFLIFTLFGEYVIHRGGKIWTSDLLELMALLGLSERAVRSTLSRMSRKGWIKSQKRGRQSQYYITPQGYALLEAGERRIFEPIISDWDGNWHLVVYSLPEEARRKRNTLRQQLNWLSFGTLSPGTWISPHNRFSDLKSLFQDLDVEEYVDIFSGTYLGPAQAQELVQRCWDLEGLAEQYREFIENHQPEYNACLSQSDGSGESDGREEPRLEPEECFVRNFWLVHDFQSFPLIDPNLPVELLPPDWVGFAARELFDNYHHLLGTYATRYVDEVMGTKRTAASRKPLVPDKSLFQGRF